jgi:hypothetical protein
MKSIIAATTFVLITLPAAYAQTAQCSDGWTSYSNHFQGTCSHHGGVDVWNDEQMKEQANQWCDENPGECENSHWEGIEGHGSHPGGSEDQKQDDSN